jgi:hypothetical protein
MAITRVPGSPPRLHPTIGKINGRSSRQQTAKGRRLSLTAEPGSFDEAAMFSFL